MRCAFSILMVAFVCASSAKAAPVSTFAQASMENSLAQYLVLRSAVSMAANPAVAVECFSKFLPILKQIADDYSTQYQDCISLSNKQILHLNTLASGQRANLTHQTNSICDAIQDCGYDADVLTFFNCFAAAATKDITAVFQLSTDATDAANALTLGLRTAQDDQEACTNATQRVYVANTSEIYQLLDKCLVNRSLGDGATTAEEPASTATTDATTTTTAPDVGQGVQLVERTQCSNVSGSHTQISANGSQTQSQTGHGCQSQSTSSGAGQNQTQSGNGTQSQCSGVNCGEWKTLGPLTPMKPMDPMAPMKPMDPMAPMKPMDPMAPMKPMEPMAPMKPMEPMAPMKPMDPMAPMKPMDPMAPMKPMEPMAPMKPMEPMAPMKPMDPMAPMKPMDPMAPMKPMDPMAPMKPMEPMAPMKPMEPMAPMKPMEPMASMMPMDPMAPMKPMDPMAPMKPMDPMAPMKPWEGWPPMNPLDGMPPMKPMEPMIIDEA